MEFWRKPSEPRSPDLYQLQCDGCCISSRALPWLVSRIVTLGSRFNFGDPEGGWDFVSPGHGYVNFEELFRALNRISYTSPTSVEWEDSGMNREWGAIDTLQFVRKHDFTPSETAFDVAFQRK